jgi:RNA polymerase sigma-70 factor, ECF subfamily
MTLPPRSSSETSNDPEHADVALAAAGDRRAFERLYRAHVDRVFSLCARMVQDRGHAEELTQDVFVRVWEKLSLFRGESAFGTWLHRMAVNVVLNDRRASKLRADRRAEVDDLDQLGQDRDALRPGLAVDLESAIALLPPGARTVFVLHDVEGYTHVEIGRLLGVTAGGTKAQLHRARRLLREALDR